MKLLFDLTATQPVGNSKFHGGGEYGKIVFERLLNREKRRWEIVCIYDKNRPLDEKISTLITKNHIPLIHIDCQGALQDLVDSEEYDRFYTALPYRYYDIDFRQIQFIFTIHGLRSIEMPTDIYEFKYEKSFKNRLKFIYKQLFKNRYRKLKKTQFENIIRTTKNSQIIVPSYHTKYSLLNTFPWLNSDLITVLYSPRKNIESNELDELYDIQNFRVKKRKYFLLISGDRWIKNARRAILAFDQLFSENNGLDKKVLVLGVKDPEDYKKVIRNPDQFEFHDYVEEKELECLYKNAYCFLYPTLNEGFGYPPIESMKYGVPVICSAITSITEVCRDAAIYFNPYSIEEIKNRILYLLYEPGVWNEYSLKGKENYQFISQKQDCMLDELINVILA